MVWSLKGQQPEIPTRSERQRINLTGFVNPQNGDCLIYRSEKGDSKNFIIQLDKMKLNYTKNRKVIIYVDNARWHHTDAIRDWEKQNPRFKIDYLPPYSPDLNPIERQWWYLRKQTTQTVLFDNEEHCWDTIEEHFNNLTKEQIKTLCQVY